MAGPRWLPALISCLLFAADGSAQAVIVNGGGFNYSRGRSGRSFSLTIGGGYGFNYGLNPYYAFSPYSSSFGASRTTVIYSSPQIIAIPIILSPRSTDVPVDTPPDPPARRIPERRREAVDDVLPAPAPVQKAAPARPPEAAPQVPQVPAPQPAKVPEPPLAPALPDGATLLDRGRAAFAAGEYGRAAEFFRRAATDAADPQAAFLLIETLIALEKYSAASETARAAVERFPRWTELTIRPLELYGARSADYTADWKRLDETRAAHPDDAVLLFLAAHVRWFDGRKDEARALFRRAAPAFPISWRFLQPTSPAVL
jgi:hypothetical protein